MNVLDYIELTRYGLFRFIILFGLFLVGPVWMLFLEWRLNFENSTLVAGHFATRNAYFLVPRAREHKSSEHTLSHALLYYLRSLQRSFDSANSTTRASYIFIFCLIKCINSFNGLRHEMTQINTHTVAGTYSFKRNDVLITSRITRTFRTFFFWRLLLLRICARSRFCWPPFSYFVRWHNSCSLYICVSLMPNRKTLIRWMHGQRLPCILVLVSIQTRAFTRKQCES